MKGPNYFKPDLINLLHDERKLLLDIISIAIGILIYPEINIFFNL